MNLLAQPAARIGIASSAVLGSMVLLFVVIVTINPVIFWWRPVRVAIALNIRYLCLNFLKLALRARIACILLWCHGGWVWRASKIIKVSLSVCVSRSTSS